VLFPRHWRTGPISLLADIRYKRVRPLRSENGKLVALSFVDVTTSTIEATPQASQLLAQRFNILRITSNGGQFQYLLEAKERLKISFRSRS